MNKADYEMDFEQRRDYVMEQIAERLNEEPDVFVRACEELDSCNGFLGDARCFSMWEIDEFFSKPSELLDRMDDFDPSDDYFYYNGYGNVTTTNDVWDVYSDEHDADEVAEELVENYIHIYIDDAILKELVEVAANEDFGIEEDWEEDDDDIPEETDEEFMERINNIG